MGDEQISLMQLHQRLTIVEEFKEKFEESIEIQKELVDVGRSIIQALSWVSSAAKWVSIVGAATGTLYLGLKQLVAWGAIK